MVKKPGQGSADGKNSGAPKHAAPDNQQPTSHTPQHTTINVNNTFSDLLKQNREELPPAPKAEEPLWKYFLKNPDKIRDWAIALFFLWAMATGGVSVKDLIEVIKGGKKDDKPAATAPASQSLPSQAP